MKILSDAAVCVKNMQPDWIPPEAYRGHFIDFL